MKTLKKSVLFLPEKSHKSLEEILLENRNIQKDPSDRRRYFMPRFQDLHDPFLLPDMRVAVDRILKAKKNQERIVVFGDYDVDGVSSTALLVKFFHEEGMPISYRLPHRVHDGYGLKNYFIDELKEKNVRLIITVDCGTRDIEAIRYAKSLGIDVIITDHHAIPEVIPTETVALINPKRKDSQYPFSFLSGSGVAFKLLQACVNIFYPNLSEEERQQKILPFIDFATLGTIADCMPLTDENRTIAWLGLRQLQTSQSSGLKKLIEWRASEGDADIVGFHIGPRINAAGRMGSPYTALQMLLCGDDRLDEVLSEIEELNTKRKTSTEVFCEEAFQNIDVSKPILFYDSSKITHGIIGLIAGRLTEAFHKPAIVLVDEGEKLVASCRSPEYYNIVAVLEHFKDRFIAFGGHRQAAGFSILKKDFHAFQRDIQEKAREDLKKTDTQKKILVDAVVSLSQIDEHLLNTLEKCKPYGIGNPKPLFLIQNFLFSGIEFLGKEMRHIRFFHSEPRVQINAFWFWEFYKTLQGKKSVSLIGEIEKNTWQGKTRIVFQVKDIVVDESL